MNNVQIIMPHGMLGADESDDLLDTVLRNIAMAHGDEEHNWVSKYGIDIDNDVFMMHRYCWCEKDDCAWCGGCRCSQNAFHYFVDKKEVTYGKYNDFFCRETFDKLKLPRDSYFNLPEKWHKLADIVNKRRTNNHDLECDYCKGIGIFAVNGSEPGKGAPNFWYKPTNFKAWWYKFISRDTETNREITKEELQEILTACT